MTRVLIVDDKPENLYMLRALLQGHGYAVDEAKHGAEALVKARQVPPTLVISDLLMPVMDGYSLLKHWKADGRLKEIPFIVYTATYTDPKDERLALNLGADAFIIKPAEPEPFMARIREVLAKKERGKPPLGTETTIEENVLLKEYSEVLVRKLEEKVLQLEHANGALREDIADRKRMEAELRLRDRAMQAVSQGILITDPNQADNPIVYASAGFERITGYAPAEVVGRNCRLLQGKDTDPATIEKLREAIQARRGQEVEILNYRKDGTAFWNALSVNPVYDEGGAISYFVGVQADITDRKSLEEQFRQAQKMEAIGRLAGGVAHDFNNLLTVINGYSELLLSGFQPADPNCALVQEIIRAGERAASLTRQLLAFSRHQILAPRVLNLNAVLADSEKMLRRLIGEDIELRTIKDPALGNIKADAGQIEQILLNLAVNARDAMPRGGKVEVSTQNVELAADQLVGQSECVPGPFVALTVSDEGCGIDKSIQTRIFEPFFTTKGLKGTGLGLATVFGIVKQAGGKIDLVSDLGQGATFTIYLPRVAEKLSTTESPANVPDSLRGSETILLAEDEDGVRSLTRHLLQGNGYTVMEAANGADALRIFAKHANTIDLLITDVVMPRMSGRELADQLVGKRPGLKVLYLSGYTDDAVVHHGVYYEQTHFLQKPFGPAALALKVREVLNAT